ncbi:hypothetical protein MKEN_01381100 [Mycena kentingensis (nom. inval.)]|nr:hypothetical protein MKEN_01381100 [Mycena kentingensis (nom. inval.)]
MSSPTSPTSSPASRPRSQHLLPPASLPLLTRSAPSSPAKVSVPNDPLAEHDQNGEYWRNFLNRRPLAVPKVTPLPTVPVVGGTLVSSASFNTRRGAHNALDTFFDSPRDTARLVSVQNNGAVTVVQEGTNAIDALDAALDCSNIGIDAPFANTTDAAKFDTLHTSANEDDVAGFGFSPFLHGLPPSHANERRLQEELALIRETKRVVEIERDAAVAGAWAAYGAYDLLYTQMELLELEKNAAQDLLVITQEDKQAMAKRLLNAPYQHTPGPMDIVSTRLRVLLVDAAMKKQAATRPVAFEQLRPVATSEDVDEERIKTSMELAPFPAIQPKCVLVASGIAIDCNLQKTIHLLHVATKVYCEDAKDFIPSTFKAKFDGQHVHLLLPASGEVVGDGTKPHKLVYGGIYCVSNLRDTYASAFALPVDLPSEHAHRAMGVGMTLKNGERLSYQQAVAAYTEGKPEVEAFALHLVHFDHLINAVLELAYHEP